MFLIGQEDEIIILFSYYTMVVFKKKTKKKKEPSQINNSWWNFMKENKSFCYWKLLPWQRTYMKLYRSTMKENENTYSITMYTYVSSSKALWKLTTFSWPFRAWSIFTSRLTSSTAIGRTICKKYIWIECIVTKKFKRKMPIICKTLLV